VEVSEGIVNVLSGLSSRRLVCHTSCVCRSSSNRYMNHRFPAEIISRGIWLYYCFCLSYRDVEELLFARGGIVTSEAIPTSCRKLGQFGGRRRSNAPFVAQIPSSELI
jgi:hypothetical protein